MSEHDAHGAPQPGAERFRGLIVEHERLFATGLRDKLVEQFRMVGCTVDFEIELAAATAIRRLHEERFDLVVTDQMFPPPGDPDAARRKHVWDGKDVIRTAKERDVRAILGYTVSKKGLYSQAMEAGAHLFVGRGDLVGSLDDTCVPELARLLRGDAPASLRRASDPRAVAIVHGANLRARDAVRDFLEALDLRPVVFADAAGSTGEGTPEIPATLDRLFADFQAVVVLLSPDEQVALREGVRDESDLQAGHQARPNVYFEAGMAFARDAQRTIVVQIGTLRRASDLNGRLVLQLDDDDECRDRFEHLLRQAGCAVRADHRMYKGSFRAALDGIGG